MVSRYDAVHSIRIACLFYAHVLDAFAFGDEAASSLDVNVGHARIILFALTAMMSATIVSMIGSIGFVGLVVPHADAS
ncbi:ABC-type Fe3+-siderophore transport system permease subunit [Ochrobactrum sp. RC6B]|nr:ABC-type Fe3+-siderophore transport system permease subunit [Ochrobactrum sp. RC6B]